MLVLGGPMLGPNGPPGGAPGRPTLNLGDPNLKLFPTGTGFFDADGWSLVNPGKKLKRSCK